MLDGKKPGLFSLRTFVAVVSVLGILLSSAFYVGITKAGIDGNKENIAVLGETDATMQEDITDIKIQMGRFEIKQETMAEDIGDIKGMNREILTTIRRSVVPGVSG